MSTPDAFAAPLQFDAVEPVQAAAGATITCSKCRTELRSMYHQVNGKVHCSPCRAKVEAEVAKAMSAPGGLGRAILFGLGGSLVGGAAYAAMLEANLLAGIVAVGIGFLVGGAVHKGAGGRVGRQYQVVAVVLTYLAIGIGYVPFAIQGAREDRAAQAADAKVASPTSPAQASSAQPQPGQNDAAPTPVRSAAGPAPTADAGAGLAILVAILLGVVSLPVIVAFAEPFTLLLLAIGMWRAWRLAGTPTAGSPAVVPTITGPHRIAAPVEA